MNKTRTARAKVTPVERRALEIVAEQDGLKISELLRELIRQEAQRRGVWSVALGAVEGQSGQQGQGVQA